MARTKKASFIEPLKMHSLNLTPATEQVLHELSLEASDVLGWTVSHSAILRAVLSYIDQQPPEWATAELFPRIEQEIAQGRVWGRKKKRA
jgi:hypothetical protein